MSVALLDFSRHRRNGWATYPITVNGCVRVLSNPAYPTVATAPDRVIEELRAACSAPDHQFWADSVNLTDKTLFFGPPSEGIGTSPASICWALQFATMAGSRRSTGRFHWML